MSALQDVPGLERAELEQFVSEMQSIVGELRAVKQRGRWMQFHPAKSAQFSEDEQANLAEQVFVWAERHAIDPHRVRLVLNTSAQLEANYAADKLDDDGGFFGYDVAPSRIEQSVEAKAESRATGRAVRREPGGNKGAVLRIARNVVPTGDMAIEELVSRCLDVIPPAVNCRGKDRRPEYARTAISALCVGGWLQVTPNSGGQRVSLAVSEKSEE